MVLEVGMPEVEEAVQSTDTVEIEMEVMVTVETCPDEVTAELQAGFRAQLPTGWLGDF